MNATLRYRNLSAQRSWHRHLEEQLEYLHNLTAISAADVILEHQPDANPAFRVHIRLEVPGPGVHPQATRRSPDAAPLPRGPDLSAEAADHTLEAALRKATQDLEQQVQARRLRQLEREKGQLQLTAMSGRWPPTQAGLIP